MLFLGLKEQAQRRAATDRSRRKDRDRTCGKTYEIPGCVRGISEKPETYRLRLGKHISEICGLYGLANIGPMLSMCTKPDRT